MKKLKALALVAILLCGALTCTHVHNNECGKDGIDCQHKCVEIMPRDDEMYPL